MSLQEEINKACLAKGLTQKQLALKAGVKPCTVSLIRSGSRIPSVKLLNNFETILGLAPGSLVALRESRKTRLYEESGKPTSQEAADEVAFIVAHYLGDVGDIINSLHDLEKNVLKLEKKLKEDILELHEKLGRLREAMDSKRKSSMNPAD